MNTAMSVQALPPHEFLSQCDWGQRELLVPEAITPKLIGFVPFSNVAKNVCQSAMTEMRPFIEALPGAQKTPSPVFGISNSWARRFTAHVDGHKLVMDTVDAPAQTLGRICYQQPLSHGSRQTILGWNALVDTDHYRTSNGERCFPHIDGHLTIREEHDGLATELCQAYYDKERVVRASPFVFQNAFVGCPNPTELLSTMIEETMNLSAQFLHQGRDDINSQTEVGLLRSQIADYDINGHYNLNISAADFLRLPKYRTTIHNALLAGRTKICLETKDGHVLAFSLDPNAQGLQRFTMSRIYPETCVGTLPWEDLEMTLLHRKR